MWVIDLPSILFNSSWGIYSIPKESKYTAKLLSINNETQCVPLLTVCYYHVTYEFRSESTLYSLPECQGTPCSKQASYMKFKWQQWDWNPKPPSS